MAARKPNVPIRSIMVDMEEPDLLAALKMAQAAGIPTHQWIRRLVEEQVRRK